MTIIIAAAAAAADLQGLNYQLKVLRSLHKDGDRRTDGLLINSRPVAGNLKVEKYFFASPKDFSCSVKPCGCD